MPVKPKRRSTAEMIEQHGGRTKGQLLWITTIPERKDVDRMLDARVPRRVIVEWLAVDCGYGDRATPSRLTAYVESPNGRRPQRAFPPTVRR